MRIFCAGLLAAGLLSVSGCGPLPDPAGRAQPDLRPPGVDQVRSISSTEVELCFDEEAEVLPGSLRVQPELAVRRVPGPGARVVVVLAPQECGRQYTLEAAASDARGNRASFAADFCGYNPQVPRVLLNELTPRGSETHPDLLELRVRTAGNMGGVVFYQGTPGDFDNRFVFPPFPVSPGDFILLHLKPSGAEGEDNELGDRTASHTADASDTAFDLWLTGANGLGGNNGVLTLYERLGGKLMDGVLYSNRTSDSDESYRGFGSSRNLARAEQLVSDGGWKISSGRVSPEDGVNPEGSTSTRSLCRSSQSTDTDSAADWHIAPTRGSTFGAENTDEAYQPAR